jgi:predicted PurR-regulated permease PerM
VSDTRTSSRRRWVLLALFVVVVWFSWTVRAVLNPVLCAYLLAYVLNPLVVRLERRGFTQRTAVGVIFTGFALTILVVGLGVIVQARDLWTDMAQAGGVIDQIDLRLKSGIEQGLRYLGEWGVIDPATFEAGGRPGLRELIAQLGVLWNSDVDVGQAGKVGMQAASGALGFARGFFGSIFSLATLLFLLPIYTYFLMFELRRIHDFVLKYVPLRDRGKVVSIGTQIGAMLSAFLRGRLLVSFLKGAFIAVGLALIGVPYALLLGLIAAVFSLVPVLGPLIAFVLGFGLALLSFDVTPALWRTGAIYLAAEFLEGYVLTPKILGDSLGLHPVVVLASLMIGGAALGLFGLLLALPLAATLIILTRELVLPALAKAAAERR